MVALALFLVACGTVYLSRNEYRKHAMSTATAEHAPLYLPHAHYVRLVTLGYDTFFSKLLWFNTINYFGKQFASTQDYRWLASMCDVVTVLDPRANHAVEFCGTLLAWVAKEPRKSVELLTRAIEADPTRWRYRYLRGFNNWYFMERLDLAREDFLKASELPGAPAFLSTMASRLVADEHGPTLARQFLQEMISKTSDPAAKKALKRKLKAAKLSERMYSIERAADEFRKAEGRDPTSIEEILEKGHLKAIPADPYNGKFFLDNGEVKTTSNRKGLQFAGKTAKTGIFKDEFKDLIP